MLLGKGKYRKRIESIICDASAALLGERLRPKIGAKDGLL